MFITLNMVQPGPVAYDEDTGTQTVSETSKPVLINVGTIRCLYGRRDGKPGTRITFNDGGGFAVTEAPDHIASLVASGDTSARLALAAPASETAS